MRLVLASGNRGKLAEFDELFADSGIELIAQSALGVSDIEETGLTFVENAMLKARHATRATGLPALADDSGLCVDALDGAPGLLVPAMPAVTATTRRTSPNCCAAMRTVPDGRRGAYFICMLVLLRHADDPAPADRRGSLARTHPARSARRGWFRLRPGVSDRGNEAAAPPSSTPR